jgi:predicted ferric reductase
VNPQLWWYLARATGIVAWALVAASVLWGLVVSTRFVRARGAPRWFLDLHRFLGGLSVTFVALHLGTLVADSYVHFGLADVLVPFASGWKPLPVAIGIVAMYLLVAVEVTSLAMKRLPRHWWRSVHLSSFAVFWLATLHGVAAGTDAQNTALFFAYLLTGGIVLFLTMFRALQEDRSATRVNARRPVQSSSRM